MHYLLPILHMSLIYVKHLIIHMLNIQDCVIPTHTIYLRTFVVLENSAFEYGQLFLRNIALCLNLCFFFVWQKPTTNTCVSTTKSFQFFGKLMNNQGNALVGSFFVVYHFRFLLIIGQHIEEHISRIAYLLRFCYQLSASSQQLVAGSQQLLASSQYCTYIR